MDKFRVGQKVRKVRMSFINLISPSPYPIGKIGTITGARSWQTLKGGVTGYAYETDDELWCPVEEDLEPVYDGDTKSSWSECLWKPKQKETTK